MIKKLLIANRGEIVCRIIDTAKKMGIKTVAVYSTQDKEALHTKLADVAYCLGAPPMQESYLNIEKIISIAKQANVCAIHPGYGFLAENADFAKACEKANILFVGPKSETIAQMGNKAIAKHLMEKAKISTIPGYYGKKQDKATLLTEAKKIGLPLILKPAQGGGGKGMRIVTKETELPHAIESAQKESLSYFKDKTLVIEKYFPNARHIEVQIFGDNKGNVLHFFERDCSTQRRHQKILEETPACNLSNPTKEKLYQTAIEAAKAINYINAGTVEFLYVDEKHFYFMEVNTRLQVEHRITEMTTGIDFVALQLKIANNQPLPYQQKDITQQGHAVEARIYTEDPTQDFLPATGKVVQIFSPTPKPYLQIDSGIQKGDKIDIYYDPMVAKVITHGKNRQEAFQRLSQALNEYEIIGPKNNIDFLRTLLKTKVILQGGISTHYLSQNLKAIYPHKKGPPKFLLQAALACLLHQKAKAKENALASNEPNSPWHKTSGFQLNQPPEQTITLRLEKLSCDIKVTHLEEESYHLDCPTLKQAATLSGTLKDDCLFYQEHQKSKEDDTQKQNKLFAVFSKDHSKDQCYVFQNGQTECFIYQESKKNISHSTEATHALKAPMPGVITNIWIDAGKKVATGDKLITMEAMKMEHTISAHTPGTIKSIYYKIGDQIAQGADLVEFEFAYE